MSQTLSRSGDWKEVTQVARIEGRGITELYLSARPTRDEGDFTEQCRSMYEHLLRALAEHGASPHHVIREWVFFSDVDAQFQAFREIQRSWYHHVLRAAEYLPASQFLQQPPCHPGRLCELQAHALIPTGKEAIKVRSLEGTPGLASGKIVDYRGERHLYLTNLTGDANLETPDFGAEAQQMFQQAESLLRKQGFTFRDVLRTWVYVNHIDRDYAELNRVRTQFFHEQGVTRLPASTGIQGATYPTRKLCAMALYAASADVPFQAEVMHAPTMNEAPQYGSSFSRGMKVTWEDRIFAYVSGTASIDTRGEVVHVGDLEGQVRRMLLNVEQLLGAYGFGPKDIVTLITYLKEPEFLNTFYRVYSETAFPKDAPHTVVRADVCRPEWLCEIEAIAVVGD